MSDRDNQRRVLLRAWIRLRRWLVEAERELANERNDLNRMGLRGAISVAAGDEVMLVNMLAGLHDGPCGDHACPVEKRAAPPSKPVVGPE